MGLDSGGSGDSGVSLLDWGNPAPQTTAAPAAQVLISTDVVTVDFAVGFGVQTRPAAERVNSRLLKLYADGVLIYTVEDGFVGALAGLTVTWHPGFADAQPDPTIQTAVGEHCPPFRDEMYVVIKGYPMASNSAKLPVIRALISDIAMDQDPVPVAYTVQATHIVDSGGFVDKTNNLFFGYDSTTTAPHSIYEYDIQTQTELGHVTISPLSYSHIFPGDFWNEYDKDNGIVLFQAGGAIGNSLPVVAVRITDGHVLSDFGSETTSLTSSDAGLSTSNFAGLMKYRGFGATCYGLMAAGIFTEVKYLGYTHTPTPVPTAAGMPNVTMDRGGLVQGNDLTLKFDGALTMAANVNAMLSYPVLDRPELVQGFGVADALFQCHVGLVAYASKVAVITSGLAVKPGYSVTPVIEFGIINNVDVLDVGVGSVVEMFINPQDGDVMMVHQVTVSDLRLSKYHPVWSRDAHGITIVNFQIVYLDKPLSGYNVGAMRNAIRQSVLDSGSFGYVGNSNHFVVIETATGNVTYDHLLPVNINDDWSYNGVAGTIESAAIVDGKVTHIDLFGSNTAGAVNLSDLLTWLALDIGYAAEDISSENVDDTVLGGYVAQPQSVRALLTTLSEVYDFDQVENGGVIKFVHKSHDAGASIASMSESDLSPIQEWVSSSDPTLSGGSAGGTSFAQGSSPDVNNLVATVAAPDEVPADVSIDYIDPDAGYIDNSQIFRRVRFPFETVKTTRTDNYQLPIVMTASDALQRAGRLVFATFGNSITFDWRVPHKFLDLEPSDIVTVVDRDNKANLIKITQMMMNADWSFSMSGVNWSFSDNIALVADNPLGQRDPTFHGPSESTMFAFDVPLINVTDEVPGVVQIYTAVGNTNGVTFWEAARVARQLEGGTLTSLFTTTFASSFGTINGVLPQCNAAGTTFQTDNATTLTVTGRGFSANAIVSAVSDLAFLAGQRRAIVGRQGRWEIIYYKTVTKLNDHSVQITGILRGRRGTEGACDSHEVGDYFIPIDTGNWRRDLLAATDLGKQDVYYAAGFNTTTAPRADTVNPVVGATALPWAPVRLKAIYGSEVDPTAAPDYFNSCGGGDFSTQTASRVNKITVTANFTPPDGVIENLVNGNAANGPTGSTDMPSVNVTNAIITFDFHPFGFKQRITAINWEQSLGSSQGTYDVEASNDGVVWTSLASAIDLTGGFVINENTFTNVNYYWFYRLKQVGGLTSNAPWLHEIYFKTVSNVAGNDLLITWLRRDRLGQEWVTNPQVLSEATETYEIEILNGSDVVRTVTSLTSPQYVYLATDQATDGFSPPLASLAVKVYQVSALVGRGFAGAATINPT